MKDEFYQKQMLEVEKQKLEEMERQTEVLNLISKTLADIRDVNHIIELQTVLYVGGHLGNVSDDRIRVVNEEIVKTHDLIRKRWGE